MHRKKLLSLSRAFFIFPIAFLSFRTELSKKYIREGFSSTQGITIFYIYSLYMYIKKFVF